MPRAIPGAPVDTASIDEAIGRVLQAEQAARAAVAQCARDADALLQQARESARAITERAAARIARAQGWAQARLRTRLAGIEQARALLSEPAAAEAPPAARLDAVIARLAEELTAS